jgi:hypothetical protein
VVEVLWICELALQRGVSHIIFFDSRMKDMRMNRLGGGEHAVAVANSLTPGWSWYPQAVQDSDVRRIRSVEVFHQAYRFDDPSDITGGRGG